VILSFRVFINEKIDTEKIQLQKKINLRTLRFNTKLNNLKKVFKRQAWKKYSGILNFTGELAIYKPANRTELLENINVIQKWDIEQKPLYLDFSKLTSLDACSTSLFVHNLNKYQNVRMKGKPSKKCCQSYADKIRGSPKVRFKKIFLQSVQS
jgi:ABC-type transporter Mla MlaB component